MVNEVYIRLEGRVVRINLKTECAYTEVEWDDGNLDREEQDEELEKARIRKIINECLE